MSTTAGARAYEQIRSMITQGRFSPGTRLKEEELTALCGVSRTPVREALRRLSAEGLILKNPHLGAQVASVDASELEEIYSLRAILESHAAARAATRISAEAIARLSQLAAEMEAAAALGEEAIHAVFPACNAEFHRILLESAVSPRLVAMAASVMELPLVLRTLAIYSAEDRQRSLRQHRELINALEARDAAWASAVMQAHIYNAYHALLRAPSEADVATAA